MAEITLAKALKIKNRLTGRLAKVQADIQAFNSVPEGQAGQVNVPTLIQTREELVGALVSLKSAINEANREAQRDIYELAEKKGTIQFLSGINTRHGPQPAVYPNTTEVSYVAALRKADVDTQVARLEKEIDQLVLAGSRMGIYQHGGTEGGRVRLKELVTDNEFTCHVPAGYRGKPGELWYVRLCPPLLDQMDYHVAFTTPYILIGFSKADWTAYLNKSLLGATDTRKALHEFLKFGKMANSRRPDESWNEFIFQAYHHHQPDAIFLAGLPDVKGSLPHA